ncbi:MAG: GNAT family N-acetyltransferase [Anaerolineae bacterium]
MLDRLMQLYLHDFDEYLSEGVDESGRFALDFELRRYVMEPGFWAYLCWVDDRLGGFSLISERVEHRTGPGRFVDEFFVLRTYRHQGVGRRLAHLTFDTFAGYWEVVALEPNQPAVAFWQTVIADYTQGAYETFTIVEDGMGLVWYTFDSAGQRSGE